MVDIVDLNSYEVGIKDDFGMKIGENSHYAHLC